MEEWGENSLLPKRFFIVIWKKYFASFFISKHSDSKLSCDCPTYLLAKV